MVLNHASEGGELLTCEIPSCLSCRCVWPVLEELSDSGSLPLDVGQSPITRSVPRKPPPPVVIQRLRELAGKPQPTLRSSTRLVPGYAPWDYG